MDSSCAHQVLFENEPWGLGPNTCNHQHWRGTAPLDKHQHCSQNLTPGGRIIVSNYHFKHVVTDSCVNTTRARECDERTAAEIESSHKTGVLKNHRNNAYTWMSQNLTRVNLSQRKQLEAQERETAVDDIENEISMLTKSHQETRDRIKSLKASKKTYIRKRKSSSKAESNSSGRVRTTTSSSTKTKVTTAAKVGFKKVCNRSLFIHLILTTSWTPAKINSRRDFASSSTAQAPGHVMTVSHMDSGSRTDVLEGGEVWQADWVNASGTGGLLSGMCFLIFTVLIIIIHSFCYRTTAGRTFTLREPGTCFAGYHGWSCPQNTFYSKWYGFWWYVFGNSCL